jgi:hypothetical protein
MPLQEGIDSLYSTILTNQSAFGVQNLYVPKGSDISVNNLGGGLNIIEGNPQFGKPEPMNLTNTPAEVFNFLQLLERSIETISGVNSVTRGNPEASLRSGSALALVQSMTLQFMSGLQQEYVKLMEDVGTGLVYLLKDFAKAPRVAAVVGKNNKTYMREFTGDDLSSISRVVVDVGNPLSRTTAGRVQMAEQMLQMGVIQNPKDYISVINTGNLNTLTEDTQDELFLVKGENEKLARGEQVVATIIDNHMEHINSHKSVLADPDLRQDTEVVQNTLDHIQEHINMLREGDPELLQMLGQQPLQPSQPQGGTMAGDAATSGDPALSNLFAPGPAQDAQGNIELRGPGIEGGVNIPNIPSPPEPFQDLPVTADELLPES